MEAGVVVCPARSARHPDAAGVARWRPGLPTIPPERKDCLHPSQTGGVRTALAQAVRGCYSDKTSGQQKTGERLSSQRRGAVRATATRGCSRQGSRAALHADTSPGSLVALTALEEPL